CRTEYRLAPRTDQERAGRERWVAMQGTVVRGANGRAEQLLGVTHDITERKHADLLLAERNTQLELASNAARVGSFSVDLSRGRVRLTLACAALFGLPEGTGEMSREDARKLVHPEDLPQLELRRDQTFNAQQREFNAQFRIVRAADGEVRWIEARNLVFY